ncbi:flagellar basal body P-ring formation chaperone FlgA [Serratia ureilytica]
MKLEKMTMKGKMLLLIGLLCSLNARADDLATQIESFIQGKFSGEPVQVKVRVRTPPNQWPACELPQLSLPPNARIGGNVSISARCGQERRFIQTQVQVFGRYLVSARGINAGSRLTAADLTLKEGRLDTLPPRADRSGQSIRRRQPAQHQPGQPLTLAMLRRAWIIKAGQPVQVGNAQGEGFSISGAGKAMNNAAAEDSVRVRMASGQIVSGVVGDDGAIRITL